MASYWGFGRQEEVRNGFLGAGSGWEEGLDATDVPGEDAEGVEVVWGQERFACGCGGVERIRWGR